MKKPALIATIATGVVLVGGGAWGATMLAVDDEPAGVEAVHVSDMPSATPTVEPTPEVTETATPTPAPVVTPTSTPEPVETPAPEPVEEAPQEPEPVAPEPPSNEESFLAQARMLTALSGMDDATILGPVPMACDMPYAGAGQDTQPFPDLDIGTNGNYISLAHDLMC